MSAGWVQALRAFAARAGPAPTLTARQRLYDQVAQAHLPGRRDETVGEHDLNVLRETRWMLLHDGATDDKAQLLEHIMKSLAEASGGVTYEASRSAKSERAPRHTTLRHQLLLEQIQCLVEAKVSEIPLTARHYRYPLRSPFLAEVSPELPLLLLDDLAQHPRTSAASAAPASSSSSPSSSADWEAQVDCCASLAGAGHTREAVALCGGEGSIFRAALQRVARQTRDGWRRAWALAETAPVERFTSGSAAYSEDWLRGVLEAAQLRSRAGDQRESVAVFAWVDELRRRTQLASRGNEMCQASPRHRHVIRRAERLVMETYLAVCPPTHWREAVGVVLTLKAATATAPSASPVNDDADAAGVVSAGRVMALLQFAEQPWMVLLFFYGNPLDLCAAAEAWAVDDAEVRCSAEALVKAAKESDRLAVATGSLLRDRDVQHAAVYNHAMAALAATGHHEDAVQFYHAIPVACVNAYTHWGVLQLFLQPNSSRTVASALTSQRNYEHCQLAVRRLVRTMPDSSATAACGDARDAAESFTRDQANVWESMTLWAALRRDVDGALLCATHAPPSCRYVHVIALIAAANAQNFAVVRGLVRRLAVAPRTTGKELCLAAAVVLVYFPMVQYGGSKHTGDRAARPSAAAEEVIGLYDDLTRSLAKSIARHQVRLDDAVQVLVDNVGSLQRRRRGAAVTAEEMQSALADLLIKANILNSTMDLARPTNDDGTTAQGDADEDEGASAAWRSTAQLIQQVGSQQGLSVARAAPALVSAGVSAEIAIDLLPM